MHEHVLVDFIGASEVNPGRYDPDQAFRIALPHLVKVRDLGCASVVECTPAYIGRDVRLLQRLADASGLDMKAARLTMERLKETEAAGFGDEYHPVVLNVIDPL